MRYAQLSVWFLKMSSRFFPRNSFTILCGHTRNSSSDLVRECFLTQLLINIWLLPASSWNILTNNHSVGVKWILKYFNDPAANVSLGSFHRKKAIFNLGVTWGRKSIFCSSFFKSKQNRDFKNSVLSISLLAKSGRRLSKHFIISHYIFPTLYLPTSGFMGWLATGEEVYTSGRTHYYQARPWSGR